MKVQISVLNNQHVLPFTQAAKLFKDGKDKEKNQLILHSNHPGFVDMDQYDTSRAILFHSPDFKPQMILPVQLSNYEDNFIVCVSREGYLHISDESGQLRLYGGHIRDIINSASENNRNNNKTPSSGQVKTWKAYFDKECKSNDTEQVPDCIQTMAYSQQLSSNSEDEKTFFLYLALKGGLIVQLNLSFPNNKRRITIGAVDITQTKRPNDDVFNMLIHGNLLILLHASGYLTMFRYTVNGCVEAGHLKHFDRPLIVGIIIGKTAIIGCSNGQVGLYKISSDSIDKPLERKILINAHAGWITAIDGSMIRDTDGSNNLIIVTAGEDHIVQVWRISEDYLQCERLAMEFTGSCIPFGVVINEKKSVVEALTVGYYGK